MIDLLGVGTDSRTTETNRYGADAQHQPHPIGSVHVVMGEGGAAGGEGGLWTSRQKSKPTGSLLIMGPIVIVIE